MDLRAKKIPEFDFLSFAQVCFQNMSVRLLQTSLRHKLSVAILFIAIISNLL